MRRLSLVVVVTLAGAVAPLIVASPAGAANVTATCANLQAVLDAANNGDVITITDATCTNRSYRLKTGIEITLQGAPTTFDGKAPAADRILSGLDNGNLALRSLTFANSISTTSFGGAVSLTGTVAPSFDGLRLVNNASSGFGGAVSVDANPGGTAPITVRNSVFGGLGGGGNRATSFGGAIFLQADNPVVISDSQFLGNSTTGAGFGGGAVVTGVSLARGAAFVRNVFAANTGPNFGGGLFLQEGGGVTLDANLFEGNEAGSFGAGAFVASSTGAVALTGNRFINQRIRCATNNCSAFGAGLFVQRAGTGPGGIDLRQKGNLFAGASFANLTDTITVFGMGEYMSGFTATISGDQFVNNTVGQYPGGSSTTRGGGLLANGIVSTENLVAAGNRAEGRGYGVGIFYSGSGGQRLGLLHASVAGNETTTTAVPPESGSAGVFIGGSGLLEVTNSIIAANRGSSPDLTGTPSSNLRAAFSDVCRGVGFTGGPFPGAGNICADPLLASPGPGSADVHQTLNSPTIDKGSLAAVPASLSRDYEGDPRVRDGDSDGVALPDMGADEFGPTPPSCPGPVWYLAEGTTRDGFDEFLQILNTDPSPASLTITYTVDGGPNVTRSFSLAGQTRLTVQVFDPSQLGRGKDHGTIVSADRAVLVERSIYLNAVVAGRSINGDHNAIAVAAPQTRWYFSEATSLADFQTYFTIANPTPTNGVATLIYGLEGGGTVTKTKAVPALSRVTVDANSTAEGAGPGVVGFSTVISATVPVLAERPVYFDHAFPFATGDVGVNGATDAFGVSPAKGWYLAEGNVLPDFAMYLTLGNPGAGPADVQVTYNLEGQPSISRNLTVATGSRLTVPVFDQTAPGGIGRDVSNPVSRGVGVKVTTSAPGGIVVERAMYFGHTFDPAIVPIFDGHATAAYPGFEKVWYFAEGTGLPDFRHFLTLSNPGAAPATVQVTYFPDDLSGNVSKTVTVPAGQRLTIQTYNPSEAGGYGQGKTGFSMKISSDQPILAERPAYEDHDFPGIGRVNGGNVSIGLPNTCVGSFS